MGAIAVLGVLSTLIGVISILVGAFRVHIAWGLLILFAAPVTLPIFLIRHIRLARTGLILIVVGLLAVSYAAFSEAKWPPHRYLISLTKPEKLGPLGRVIWGKRQTEPVTAEGRPAPADNKARLQERQASQAGQLPVNKPADEPADVSDAGQGSTAGATTKESPPPEVLEKIEAKQKASTPARYIEFTMDELSAYFGNKVRVTDIDNKVHDAILKDQDGSSLVFEKQYGSGGVVEFRLESRNIIKMEALRP